MQVKAGAKGGTRKGKVVAKNAPQKEARRAQVNKSRGLATKTQGGVAGGGAAAAVAVAAPAAAPVHSVQTSIGLVQVGDCVEVVWTGDGKWWNAVVTAIFAAEVRLCYTDQAGALTNDGEDLLVSEVTRDKVRLKKGS